MLSDRCPVCPILSVTLVYCGQMFKWIRMPLGTKVGLSPGNIVLDGDSASPTERGTAAPHFSAHFALARSPISATAELLYVCAHGSELKTCDHRLAPLGRSGVYAPLEKILKSCLIWSKRDRERQRRSVRVILVHSFHTYSCKN